MHSIHFFEGQHTMSLTAELALLSSWETRLPHLGIGALGGVTGRHLYMSDLVVIGALHRSLRLATGLKAMVEARNIVCSRAILRMQVDTVSRILAYSYVDDPEATAQGVIAGKPLNKFKSSEGCLLRDAYLIDRMARDYPWVREVYALTSAYVHFSERQFFDSVASTGGDGSLTFNIEIGPEDSHPEFSWEEVVACFNHLLSILEGQLPSRHRGLLGSAPLRAASAPRAGNSPKTGRC